MMRWCEAHLGWLWCDSSRALRTDLPEEDRCNVLLLGIVPNLNGRYHPGFDDGFDGVLTRFLTRLWSY